MFEIGKDFGEKLSFLNKLLFVMESLKDVFVMESLKDDWRLVIYGGEDIMLKELARNFGENFRLLE
ncbi:hypothetical protein Leryth_026259 [Lithospermum erythrorhizon]|nr:hypothetical protein Leryth_026259 [Lithospermum erythrorhizon]